MEALSRSVSCDTIVNVWIVWQCQYSMVYDGAFKQRVSCPLTSLHVHEAISKAFPRHFGVLQGIKI